MQRFARLAAALLPLLAAIAGCSQLGIFDALVPGDRGVRTAATGVAYGLDSEQKLDIYVPDGAGSARPVVTFIHGGSWSSGSRGDYAFVGKAFAARGFVSVVVDYRLAPKVRYPAFVEDSAAAVAWVHAHIAQYGGDPKRLFLAGHSAGAYNAMMVALAPEFLRRQGLSPSVLSGVAGLSGPYDFLPLDDPSTVAAFRGVRNLPSSQPVNRAGSAAAAPPAFLATGDADETVRPRNTSSLAAALRRAGKPVETRVYPGLGHAGTLLAISRPLRGRAAVLDDVIAFFQDIDRRRSP